MTNSHWGREPIAHAVLDLMEELTGLFDPAVLGQQAATGLARRLGLPLASVALLDEQHDEYAMTSTCGARTSDFPAIRLRQGQGLGGRAIADRALFAVEDYSTDERISDHFRSIVGRERLRGMAAAPIMTGGMPIGLLYGSRRDVGGLSDRALDTLDTAARTIAPVLAASMHAEAHARLKVDEERQRLAGSLHDDVAQLLFSINSSARRARELSDPDDQQTVVLDRIEREAQDAADRLREALRGLAPPSPRAAVPAVAQQDVDDFSDRAGVPAYLILRGEVAALPALAERVLAGCLRQALFNIEQHADASLVVVTLDYQTHGTNLVVQDDGQGLPPTFEPTAVPSGSHHWGHVSMMRQVEQIGGSVSLEPGDEGGAQLRAWIPHVGSGRADGAASPRRR